jgi:hypothetical protein
MYLSENALIAGLGMRSTSWNGITVWGEAGRSIGFRNQGSGTRPDYRGGLSFARGFGRLLSAKTAGLFLETNADAVFVSRFERDTILYSQVRAGYTLAGAPAAAQIYWNNNVTADVRRLYWANTYEHGPGIRFRHHAMPKAMYIVVDALSGRYPIVQGNPYGPTYRDFRAGIWYAFTR